MTENEEGMKEGFLIRITGVEKELEMARKEIDRLWEICQKHTANHTGL